MGFLKSLLNMVGGEKCPVCGTPGAQKSGDQVRCLNPLCRNFMGAPAQPPSAPQPPQQPKIPTQQPTATSSQSFARSSAGTVSIQYRNFQGQNKTFAVEANSIRRRKNHILARVAPSGKDIALSRDRIQNMSDVDAVLPERDRSGSPRPDARERQVLGYHRKNGTTSPLYEKVRAKYPNW